MLGWGSPTCVMVGVASLMACCLRSLAVVLSIVVDWSGLGGSGQLITP